MKIPTFHSVDTQVCIIGKHEWSVARLIELSRELAVIEAPIDCLDLWHTYESLRLRDMVMHFNTVKAADLSCPIILDEDGVLMDGRHRIMKALSEGRKTILAVRFDENPKPCRVLD